MLKSVVPTSVKTAVCAERGGVDGEHVLVGQVEADRGAPVAAERILPLAADRIELDDQAGLRRAAGRRVRARRRAGRPGMVDAVARRTARRRRSRRTRRPRRGPSSGCPDLKIGRVDRAAVGADRERARRVAEQGDDPERDAAERAAERAGVEDPDVGAADAGGGELRIARARARRRGTMSVRCWPRCAVVMKARLPPGRRRRCRAARRRPAACARRAADRLATSTMLTLSERWLTTHTSPSERAATATGSRPTGTEPRVDEPAGRDVEDLEPVVRRVDGEQPARPARAPAAAPGRSRRW